MCVYLCVYKSQIFCIFQWMSKTKSCSPKWPWSLYLLAARENEGSSPKWWACLFQWLVGTCISFLKRNAGCMPAWECQDECMTKSYVLEKNPFAHGLLRREQVKQFWFTNVLWEDFLLGNNQDLQTRPGSNSLDLDKWTFAIRDSILVH